MRTRICPSLKQPRSSPACGASRSLEELFGRATKKVVKTRFGPATVSWAILRDETGSIRLNLWRTQIDAVMVGDVIRLVNAFVKVYGGEMELNVGSDGRIDMLERGT